MLGYALNSSGEVVGVAAGEYYRLLTAAFLHGGVLHIAFNMWVLFALGPQLEQVLGPGAILDPLPVVGAGRLGGVVPVQRVERPLGGASGAIFGLMGATLVVGKRCAHDVTNVVRSDRHQRRDRVRGAQHRLAGPPRGARSPVQRWPRCSPTSHRRDGPSPDRPWSVRLSREKPGDPGLAAGGSDRTDRAGAGHRGRRPHRFPHRSGDGLNPARGRGMAPPGPGGNRGTARRLIHNGDKGCG